MADKQIGLIIKRSPNFIEHHMTKISQQIMITIYTRIVGDLERQRVLLRSTPSGRDVIQGSQDQLNLASGEIERVHQKPSCFEPPGPPRRDPCNMPFWQCIFQATPYLSAREIRHPATAERLVFLHAKMA